MRKLIEKLEDLVGLERRGGVSVTENKVEAPPGFEGKTVTSKIKRVSYATHNGGLSFMIAGKVYDDYLKDQIAAIEPGIEKSIEYLRKAKYTDEEAQQVFDDARAAGSSWGGIELPRPVTIKWTVFKRKW